MAAPELDHIMIFCDSGAPEADVLLARGLHEGPGNEHPGQGTVNRRFFFRNVYLELLWFENFEEARKPEVQRTGLWDRWVNRANGGCPIGFVLRPGAEGSPTPFRSWTYVPKYFPAGFSIEVACDIPANEPLLVYLPFARPAVVEDVAPPNGVKIGPVAGFTLYLPGAQPLSSALNSLVSAGVVSVESGHEVLIDIHHQPGTREIIDLRPRLPVRFVPIERRSKPAQPPAA
ncbi:MAG TPA: VOC family protein [Steroidobacteraceae bacterium]|nr:VOC family protein [Steroidobacteraceae bacterium]